MKYNPQFSLTREVAEHFDNPHYPDYEINIVLEHIDLFLGEAVIVEPLLAIAIVAAPGNADEGMASELVNEEGVAIVALTLWDLPNNRLWIRESQLKNVHPDVDRLEETWDKGIMDVWHSESRPYATWGFMNEVSTEQYPTFDAFSQILQDPNERKKISTISGAPCDLWAIALRSQISKLR